LKFILRFILKFLEVCMFILKFQSLKFWKVHNLIIWLASLNSWINQRLCLQTDEYQGLCHSYLVNVAALLRFMMYSSFYHSTASTMITQPFGSTARYCPVWISILNLWTSKQTLQT
jgi:hypothetical protein